jgi:hypothetical protein
MGQMIEISIYRSVFYQIKIGLDTINNAYIKPSVAGSQAKHLLIIKTQSPGGSKY